MQSDSHLKSMTGIIVAIAIIGLWLSSLSSLWLIDMAQTAPVWVLLAIWGRTFIQTGLFIVAHDAIHGTVAPGNRRLNHLVGQLAVTLYALLSYQKLVINHWHHHQQPGQANDPDFHDGVNRHVLGWYFKFMKGYLDVKQRTVIFWGVTVIFFTLYLGLGVPLANLFLFWILPIVLSSVQLFVFGTYLPHGSSSLSSTEIDPASSLHHAVSSDYPLVISFLTCYHFGYHWEHHEYPRLAWYELPSVHRRKPPNQLHPISPPLVYRLAATLPLLTLLLIATS